MNQIHLLLADERRPALPDGLDAASLDRVPLPGGARKVDHLFGEDQVNDLRIQRWAVVYPKGRPELLDAVGPLIALRERQQERPAMRLPVDPTDDGRSLYQQLYDGKIPVAEQPRYLLVLGDLDEVSLELQLRLAAAGSPGRLAFDTLEDYRSYADKVLRWDAQPQAGPTRLLLYGAHDRYDGAMRAGEDDLLVPVQAAAEAGGRAVTSFGRAAQSPVDGLGALLTAAAEARPSLLLSVTHGLGSGRWGPEERRRRQGALRIVPGVALEAAQLRERSFLPGGLWACFACFGAGTPAVSRYDLWLRDLVSSGSLGGAPDVLGTLAVDRPFVSALARAALANPEGPLGVLGHVDLAWGWSFRDEAAGGQSRAGRFSDLLVSAAGGDRFGLGLGPIARAQRGAGHMIIEYAEKERAGTLSDEDRKARGHDWMTWHDLGAWILLGDPAARLPLAPPRALSFDELLGLPVAAPQPTVTAADALDPHTLEGLILAKLMGEPDARARAAAKGLSWSELRQLEQLYTEAGREALAARRR